MRNHQYPLKSGINRTSGFEKKRLCSFAVNVGIKCGHDCLYCSTGSMLRMHPAFRELGEDPFGHGYAIVDPDTPERVAKDAQRIRKRGLVQLCTTVDAWAPEAQEYDLGRQCLRAILHEPGWRVRVLTKNAAARKEFDLISQHRSRVLVGLSITATAEKTEIMKIIEPNTSSIQERMLALAEAAARGLRTYAMLCPLLPGVADSPEQIDQLVQFAEDRQAEEIFVEPVNPRGSGLKDCQQALELWGYPREANAIKRICNRANWSRYVLNLLRNVQRSVRKHSDTDKLRFLLYPSNLLPEDAQEIREDDTGVVWLKSIADGKPRETIQA